MCNKSNLYLAFNAVGLNHLVWLHGLGAHYSDAHTLTILSNAYASTSALKWLREIKSAGKDATQTLHKHKQTRFQTIN